jgi:hypothetical protein
VSSCRSTASFTQPHSTLPAGNRRWERNGDTSRRTALPITRPILAAHLRAKPQMKKSSSGSQHQMKGTQHQMDCIARCKFCTPLPLPYYRRGAGVFATSECHPARHGTGRGGEPRRAPDSWKHLLASGTKISRRNRSCSATQPLSAIGLTRLREQDHHLLAGSPALPPPACILRLARPRVSRKKAKSEMSQ